MSLATTTDIATKVAFTSGEQGKADRAPLAATPLAVTPGDGDARDGLVTCSISSRPGMTWENSQAGRAGKQCAPRHTFPTVEEVHAAAGTVAPFEWDGREGPCPTFEVGPGLVRMTWPDLNRRERAANAAANRPIMWEEKRGGVAAVTDSLITEWSSRSRARMIATIAELDIAPMVAAGPLGMTTLTYPGDWQTVAPNRAAVNKHLETLRKREARAFPQVGGMELWKFEFQRRGAPHIHRAHAIPEGVAYEAEIAAYEARRLAWELGGKQGPPPYRRPAVGEGLPYREWLALAWADVVAHPDPEERRKHERAGTGVDMDEGARAVDPRRLGVYFSKHGQFRAKDYQNEVPQQWRESGESVGRFWGYRGLQKIVGKASVSADEALFMGRTLARYAERVTMVNPVTGERFTRPALQRVKVWRESTRIDADGVMRVRYRQRWTTKRTRRMKGHNRTGYLVVNDGPAMAETLARALDTCVSAPGKRPPAGLRGPWWAR